MEARFTRLPVDTGLQLVSARNFRRDRGTEGESFVWLFLARAGSAKQAFTAVVLWSVQEIFIWYLVCLRSCVVLLGHRGGFVDGQNYQNLDA